MGEDGLVLKFLVVFRHSGHDDKANPSFLRLKVILLVCAAVEQLYTVLAVGCENLCLPKSDVTQRALLSADYGEDYVSCPQLRVNEWVERYPYPRIRLLGVSSQPQAASWKYLLREIANEGQSGLMNECC